MVITHDFDSCNGGSNPPPSASSRVARELVHPSDSWLYGKT